MINLRSYQAEIVEAARDAMRHHQSVLVRAPCGAGKTIIASYIEQKQATDFYGSPQALGAANGLDVPKVWH
jgi:ERCC4-related helicase